MVLRKNLLILSLVFYLCRPIAQAAETATPQVTARVPDIRPPTTPVLIAPENGSYISNSYPTFIFQGSTDADTPVRHYQMYLNNQLLIPEIPSSQTPVDNEQFYCLIDNNVITLTLKQPFTDGIYSWRIEAYDESGNKSSSTTWTFTVDTAPPYIIITQIAENTNLNLTSVDPNSIPPGYKLSTSLTNPTFQGKSEPGARIEITLTPTADSNHEIITFSTIVDPEGNFILTPSNSLEREETYKVTIISFDTALNSVVLPEFLLYVIAAPPVQIPLLELPTALIQLPTQAKITPLTQIALAGGLLILFSLPIIAKMLFGFSYKQLFSFILGLLIPIIFRRRRNCQVVNQQNNQGVWLAEVKVANGQTQQYNCLTNNRGRFRLILKPGKYAFEFKCPGFLTNDLCKDWTEDDNKKCLFFLYPDIEKKRKYILRYITIYILFFTGFLASVWLLLFWPNLISLALMLIYLDLAINLLL